MAFVRQSLKFGLVGLACFAIDLTVFNVLRTGLVGGDVLSDPITAKVAAAAVSTMAAWIGNRLWTFRDRRRTDVGRELVEFLVVAVIGAGIAVASLAVSHYVLGFTSLVADNIAGNGVGLVLATAFRFAAYRYVIFAPTRAGSRSVPRELAPAAAG